MDSQVQELEQDLSAYQLAVQEQPQPGAQTDKAKKRGGFECEFVEPPPDVLQSECPVCLLIIRDPYQVTCCGYSYCQSCIQRIKADYSPCLKCKSKEFTDFPDKRLLNSLKSLQVQCSHQKDGCEWTGELGQLDVHLNTDPLPGNQLDGCQFAQIACIHCGSKKQRKDIQVHQNEHCTKRQVSCEYCNAYTSHHDNVIHNHWPVCESFPVPCPNECGSSPQRQSVDSHVADVCPRTTIICDFLHVGCGVKLPRKDMPEHTRENLLKHMSLLAISHTKQQAQITSLTKENKALKSEIENLNENHRFHEANINRVKSQCNDLAAENKFIKLETKALKEENIKLKSELNTLTQDMKTRVSGMVARASSPQIPSSVLTMTNFQQHKKDKDEWISPSVYTHHQGYKIRLGVYANGHGIGEGTHVAVIVYLMQGEFDDTLKWPFRGVISFRLLDQVKGEDHKSGSNTYDDKVSERLCCRVKEGEQRSGLGLNKFISHSKLELKYLRNDNLLLQIHKIQIH